MLPHLRSPLMSSMMLMGAGPSGGGLAFVGPLDDYTTGLAGAWSVARRFLTSYEGPLIRVRRSSDDTELDIDPAADGELDTVALLAFTGAGNGFLSKIYDQSGAGRDYSQATAATQFRIVSSGVVDTNEGKPCAIGISASNTKMSLASSVSARCWMDSAKATANNSYMGLHTSASTIVNIGGSVAIAGFFTPDVANYTLYTNGATVAADSGGWCYPNTKVLAVTGDAVSGTWLWGSERNTGGRYFEGCLTERLLYSAIPADVPALSQVLEDYLGL